MKIRLAVVVFLAAVQTAAAQQNPVLFPRFSLSAGGYESDFGTKVRVDPHIEGLQGTTIDLEKNLGLTSSKTLTRATLQWRPFARHDLQLTYFRTRRSGDLNIDRQIVYEDTTFPIQANVASRFDIDFWDLSYTYWARQTQTNGLGINLGVMGMSFNGELSATVANTTVALHQDAAAKVPLPVIGLEGRYAFGDRVVTDVRGSFLPSVSIRSYKGDALLGRASAEYIVARTVGLGVGYNYFNLNGAVEKTDFHADLGMTIRGFDAFVHLVFGR